ncbi:hypothetical protein GJ496_003202 [Pomphorhynchus laevis]|nr:hypothetical protein GJ496_003202 [Pomphorhynchus laevis]
MCTSCNCSKFMLKRKSFKIDDILKDEKCLMMGNKAGIFDEYFIFEASLLLEKYRCNENILIQRNNAYYERSFGAVQKCSSKRRRMRTVFTVTSIIEISLTCLLRHHIDYEMALFCYQRHSIPAPKSTTYIAQFLLTASNDGLSNSSNAFRA